MNYSFLNYVTPYLELGRFNRPVGAWLLFIPCSWGIMGGFTELHDFFYMGLFLLGSFVMRGAGCTLNDIIDRDIDSHVERTKNRPLASQKLSLTQAFFFLGLQCLGGLIVLLNLPREARLLSLSTIPLVISYPFMKRVIPFPQLILAFCFNSGALISYVTVKGQLDFKALSLYGAGIFWTLAYDTIYAHQDKEDDALIGVKSLALSLKKSTKPALSVIYVFMFFSLSYLGFLNHSSFLYFIFLWILGIYCIYDLIILDLDNSQACLSCFKSHIYIGFLITLALALLYRV